MTLEHKMIQLIRALAMCLGALEMIDLCPDDFDRDGLKKTIREAKDVLDQVVNFKPKARDGK